MIRMIGAALIISATGAMGFAGVWRLRRRVQVLSALLTSLDLLECEICSRLTPMGELLEKLSREAPPPVRGFYKNASRGMEQLGMRSFHRLWSDAMYAARLPLTEDEERCLAELGLSLGRYDVREQAESIGRTRRRLEGFLREADLQRARDSKLHAFFGVASGLFAVILLL